MRTRCRRADLAAWGVALCLASVAGGARAQPEASPNADELAAARSLFAEALRDEEAKRFVEALQKFQRVRAVRDTASVEYRIGACHEGLGHSVPAYVAYREVTVLGRGQAGSADVVAAAIDRIHALDGHVARLTLALPKLAPADAEVRVDGQVVSRDALGEPIVLEPGSHLVTAAATAAAPSRSEIVLPEGAQVSLTVSIEPRISTSAVAAQTASPPASIVASSRPPAEAPPAAPARARDTAGWTAIAAGGVLATASAILFFVRNGDIAKLNHACPGGVCPPGSNEADLESTRSRALLEGPLSVAIGIAGAIALGSGAYLVLTSNDPPPVPRATGTRVRPILVVLGAGGIAVSGEFR
jgi:hypothetical protein